VTPTWYRPTKETKEGGMGGRKSECPIVPTKEGNSPQGTLWRDGGTSETEPLEGQMTGMSGPETISTKRQRIADLAKKAPGMAFTSLAYYIDLEWMREAYRLTRKDGAPGIDGQTAADYEQSLDGNLASLLDRAKSGLYTAPPVRRAYIPKASGSEKRPIGIPTLEDKVLQRAVVMVLEAVYEQDFLDFSYGFRPGRSTLQAVRALDVHLREMYGAWVVELDIRRFFDTLDHGHLRSIVAKRVRDGVLTRLIGKWLNAGVMEDGHLEYPEAGTPQGGVISPLLANVYLHEVLDTWFDHDVKPRLRGRSFIVRYADDAVMGFANEEDARRVLEVLPKRFAKYGLTLHPEKTRLVGFRPPRGPDDKGRPDGGAFDFLGFTNYWAKSRRGHWCVKQKTAKDRLRRAIGSVYRWCRAVRHAPLPEQHEKLVNKVMGHMGYFGITNNNRAVSIFLAMAFRAWVKWLSRRSQRWRQFGWERIRALLKRFPLPTAQLSPAWQRLVAKP
jgi:group II intron reverse transcriptase/maturase